jgi:hypothetical protein
MVDDSGWRRAKDVIVIAAGDGDQIIENCRRSVMDLDDRISDDGRRRRSWNNTLTTNSIVTYRYQLIASE